MYKVEITDDFLSPYKKIENIVGSIIFFTALIWVYLRFIKIEPFGIKNIGVICIFGIIRSVLLFLPKLYTFKEHSLKNKFFFILTFIISVIILFALTLNNYYLGNFIFSSIGNNNLLFSIIISLLVHVTEIPTIIIIAIINKIIYDYNAFYNKEIYDLYKEGVSYYEKINYDKAIECFNKIIDISPDHYGANAMLAKIAVRYPERFSEIMGSPPNWVKKDVGLINLFKNKGLM